MPEAVNSERVTFRGNLKRSRHGWLRLTPAYSVELVERLVADLPPRSRVLDPFCGTGTTLLTCAEAGLSCTTVDLNPFLVWLANSKAASYSAADCSGARSLVASMAKAATQRSAKPVWLPPISNIDRWWTPNTRQQLGRAFATLARSKRGAKSQDLARISFCRTLIACANVSFGHQSMSFKPSTGAHQVSELLLEAVDTVVEGAENSPRKPQTRAVSGDARSVERAVGRRRFDAVVTSPPYCNRMSYIRELRPYMYWLGHLDVPASAGELDWQAIGGTWGVATSRLKHWRADADLPPELAPLTRAIGEKSELLARYVQRYFADMAEHLSSLLRVLEPGAQLHYVIGNSKFYDVLLPTHELLAQQMRSAGFVGTHIQTLRSRTSKSDLYEFLVSGRKPRA